MILKNKKLEVEIKKKTLGVKVTDLRNGTTWSSPYGGFNLYAFDIGCENTQWYRSDQESDCQIELIEFDGSKAVFFVDFYLIDVGFTAVFQLLDDELRVLIPDDGWNCAGEKQFEVLSVDCLPFFGGRNAGSEGYMVLPHSGGVIRYFSKFSRRPEIMRMARSNDGRSPYAFEHMDSEPDLDVPQMHEGHVYGFQSQWKDMIAYPLWGVVDGNAAWCALIPFEKGDADTAVVTSANIGTNRICSPHCRFNYREHSHDRRVDENRELRIKFFNEQKANYATFGNYYRNYLLTEGSIPSLKQKTEASRETDYLVQAYIMRPCLALKRYSYINNPNPDGKGILDVYLSFEDLEKELRRWKKRGIDKVVVQMVGFNPGGHDGGFPNVVPIEPALGGEKGFKKLLKTIDKLGYKSSVHLDLRLYHRASLDFYAEDVMRDRDGALLIEQSGPGGDGYHACPEAVLRYTKNKVFKPLKKYGLTGGIYFDFILGILFRCYHPLHPLTRRGYLNAVKKYAKEAEKIFGSVRMESMIAPVSDICAWDARIYVNKVTEGALRSAKLAMQGLADEAVPLQAIIFHGIFQYSIGGSCDVEKDLWALFLEMISVGAKPVEEQRTFQPQWDDYHKLEYDVFCRDLKWLQFEFIENIETFGEVTKTSYSDGTAVWVNHGGKKMQFGDIELKPRSVKVVPGTRENSPVVLEENRDILDREWSALRDGSIWPGDSPREGVVIKNSRSTIARGIMIGKDFL